MRSQAIALDLGDSMQRAPDGVAASKALKARLDEVGHRLREDKVAETSQNAVDPSKAASTFGFPSSDANGSRCRSSDLNFSQSKAHDVRTHRPVVATVGFGGRPGHRLGH
jgi:hypothetical protein